MRGWVFLILSDDLKAFQAVQVARNWCSWLICTKTAILHAPYSHIQPYKTEVKRQQIRIVTRKSKKSKWVPSIFSAILKTTRKTSLVDVDLVQNWETNWNHSRHLKTQSKDSTMPGCKHFIQEISNYLLSSSIFILLIIFETSSPNLPVLVSKSRSEKLFNEIRFLKNLVKSQEVVQSYNF